MRIVLFTRSLNAGGTERQLVLLAKGLAARGHDVTVALLYGGGRLESALAGSGVRIAATGKTGRWDVAGPLLRLWRLFRDARAEAIYAFLPTQTVLAALLRPRTSRLVFGLRAGGMELRHYDRLSALAYRLERLLAGRADAIVANAAAVRARAGEAGYDAARIAVVPNGIDVETFRPDPDGRAALRREWGIGERELAIGMVARIDPMKDHATLLRAAAQFLAARPDALFVCVGDGDAAYRRSLVALAEALGVAGRVRWAGERHDLAAVYSAFDIATLSSAFGEGFSNAIGEAMACGTPVVATAVGDAALVVGETGAVVPAGDPAALAEAWRATAARRADDQALGQAARARIVAQFSVERMVADTETLLRAVVAGRPAAATASGERPC